MRIMKRISLIAMVAVLTSLVYAAQPAYATQFTTSTTLDQLLIPGNSILCDDKLFDNFGFSSIASGGATPVDPATVAVLCHFPGAEIGLRFQSGSFFVLSGQTQDSFLEFDVTSTDPQRPMIDNTLEILAGAARGTGRIAIAENLSNGVTKLVFTTSTVSVLRDHVDFSPAQSLHVVKDIALAGGANGAALLSDFSQTFSQVPEPASVILLGMGGVCALWFRRRRLEA